MTAKSFNTFLFNQTPRFDAAIMESMRPSDTWIGDVAMMKLVVCTGITQFHSPHFENTVLVRDLHGHPEVETFWREPFREIST